MGNEFFNPIQYGNDPIAYYQFKKRFITAKDTVSYEGLNESVKTFKFKDTLFKEDVNLKFIFLTGFDYHFSNCEFESFNCIEFENISFTIRNTKFSDNLISFLHASKIKLTIHSSLSNIDLSIMNCEDFRLEMINSIPIGISISDSILLNFNIGNIFKKKNLTFNSNKATFTDLKISNFEIIDFVFAASDFEKIMFNQVKCKNVILIDIVDKTVSSINISASNFSNLCFSGGYDDYIADLVEESVVGKIDNFEIYNSTNVFVRHTDITNILVKGDYNNNIKISFCSVKSFCFQNFNCLNPFRIESLKQIELDKFSIIDSNLRNLEIIPSFLHYVNSFAFNNSSILGIKIIGFEKIPESVIENSNEMSITQKIDFTRELTALMIEQNNRYLTTVYRALEQDFRLHTIRPFENMDYLILKLNSLSNSHGTKPQKALFWILLMVVIMFGIINLDLAFQTNLPYEAGFDFLSQNYSYFIKPFTFLSDVEETYKPFHSENMKAKFHPATKGFDFLFKIFYAYLLYQFIAAFRKFNK